MQVVSVGEVLIELARGADGRFTLGLTGDTFRTAIHLSRGGVQAAFATALGDDPYSDVVLETAEAEGVTTSLILRVAGRAPGLCLAEKYEDGTIHNEYWREAAPARQLFELPGWDRIAEELVSAELVYFSGVTLSLYSNVGLGRLLAALEFGRERGGKIAFDSSWRPRNWRGDEQRGRAVYSEALKRCDLALTTFGDETTLWGDASPTATIERLTTFGVKEIVVKNGSGTTLVHANGQQAEVAAPTPIETGKSTAMADAFNAAYLAARLRSQTPHAAVLAGHRLAAEVRHHAESIPPRPKKGNGGTPHA